jgi:hypothetical protein
MLKCNLVAAMSCATFSLAMSQSVAATTLTQEEFEKMSEEAVEQQRGPTVKSAPERYVVTPAEGEKSIEQVPAEAPAMPEPAAMPPSLRSSQPPPAQSQERTAMQPQGQGTMTMEERRAFYDQRYRNLRERARGAGVDMPGQPPWAGPGMGLGRQLMTDEERTAHRKAMRSMSPEERKAYRTQMHERMRERAWEEGIVLPERPPWEDASANEQAPVKPPTWADRMAAYRDRVSKMSPADREACQALGRLEMRERMGRMIRELSARMQYRQESTPRQFSQGGYGQGYPYPPEGDYGQGYPYPPEGDYGQGYPYPPEGDYGQGYPMGPGPGYGSGYPSTWGTPGAGYGSGPMAPSDDFGPGYPRAPGYGSGYDSPWGYGR